MGAPNYFDFVEKTIERKLTPDNQYTVAAMTPADISRMRGTYDDMVCEHLGFLKNVMKRPPIGNLPTLTEHLAFLNAPKPFKHNDPQPGEWRPICLREMHFRSGVLDGNLENLDLNYDLDARVNSLKKYLLYSHGIMLPDDLYLIACPWGPDQEKMRQAGYFDWKAALTNYLNFIYEIREPIQKGIINFYPGYENHGLVQQWSSYVDLEFLKWLKANRAAQKSYIEHWTVLKLLFLCSRYHQDCTFEESSHEEVLQDLLVFGNDLVQNSRTRRGDDIQNKNRLASTAVATISVPSVGDLTWKDVAAVRMNSEGFEAWRNGLREGLLRCDFEDEKHLKASIQDSLMAGRRKLEEDLRKSSLLGTAKEQSSTAMVGGILGATIATSAEEAMAKGILAPAAGILLKFVAGALPKRSKAKSLLKHYFLFN